MFDPSLASFIHYATQTSTANLPAPSSLRRHCTILSQHGTILVVPRENGMTRLYVQLPESFSDASTADPGTGKEIISAARRSLHPYMLDYSYSDWWTIYRVGQRVADHFAYKERIFLGGDAVHTHTPKGGQGMNVSMQDAYNLGWKLAGVIQGRLSRSVLKTYEAERRPVAEDLINLDADMARVLASKKMPNPLEVRRVYEKARNYISGANICYSPNILVTIPDECKQELAVELKLGMRFPSHLVFNHSSAVPLESQALLRSDGRWRVLVFGGDVTNPAQLQRVNVLGANLAGFARQFDSIRPDDRPLTEILLIYCGSIESMEIHEFHPTFSRMNASEDRFDFERIYADPLASSSQVSAHAHYGIDAEKGCIVVTRPDQCVAWIGDLEDVDGLSNHFRGFMSV
jgi:phenol 2-monooxygenase